MDTRGITSEWLDRKPSPSFPLFSIRRRPRPLRVLQSARQIYPRSPSYLGVPFIPPLPSFGPEIKGTPRCWSLVRPISLLRPAAGQDTYQPSEWKTNALVRGPTGTCKAPHERTVSLNYFPPVLDFCASIFSPWNGTRKCM